MKNILIICQARFSSTRLPGKVLLKIRDKPLLWYVVKRLEQVPNTKLIIATGPASLNQPVIEFAKKQEIDFYVGSEDDVLDRYYQTAKKFKGDIIVRITSDCPLIDPDIITNALNLFLNGEYDYISNGFPPTYPDGFDTEVFSFQALERAWKEATSHEEREHVTYYIWNNKDKFKQYNFENDINWNEFRLTVDTKGDFELISHMIEHFHDNWFDFRLEDVIKYLRDNPELLKLNAQYESFDSLKAARNIK